MKANNSSWIGVDLDGTLAKYDTWKGRTVIGEPVPMMANRVKKWLKDDIDVRVFTARVFHKDAEDHAEVVSAIEKWCKKNLGQIIPITCEKDPAMVELWDDRAVQVIPNTGVRVDSIPKDSKTLLSK